MSYLQVQTHSRHMLKKILKTTAYFHVMLPHKNKYEIALNTAVLFLKNVQTKLKRFSQRSCDTKCDVVD